MIVQCNSHHQPGITYGNFYEVESIHHGTDAEPASFVIKNDEDKHRLYKFYHFISITYIIDEVQELE